MKLVLVLTVLVTGCGKQGSQGPQGAPGQPAEPCRIEFTVKDNPVRSGVIPGYLITCPDGTTAFIADPSKVGSEQD